MDADGREGMSFLTANGHEWTRRDIASDREWTLMDAKGCRF
jgi:hypothetical protein